MKGANVSLTRCLGLTFFLILPGTVVAQETQQSDKYQERIEQLERETQRLDSEILNVRSHFSRYADDGGLVFLLAGAFCALWAKGSGRNPWLWFFMGAIFVPITVLVLLYKNAQDVDGTAPT